MEKTDVEKLRDEMQRQADQIEKDGNDPVKLGVHVQRINAHLKFNSSTINDVQKKQMMMEIRIDALELSKREGAETLKELKEKVTSLHDAVVGDKKFQRKGMIEMVHEHDKYISETKTKTGIFKVWVMPVLIGLITAVASAIVIAQFAPG